MSSAITQERVTSLLRERLMLDTDISYMHSPFKDRQYAENKREYPEWEEVILFHGTSMETAWKIWTSGFDSRKIFVRPVGIWIFCGSDPLVSHTYTKPVYNFSRGTWVESRFMVICKVLMAPTIRLNACTGGSVLIPPDCGLIQPIAVVEYQPSPLTKKLRLNASKSELESNPDELLSRLNRSTGKTYSGAGVILVENQYGRRGEQAVILYVGKSGQLEDLGGLIDSKDKGAQYPIAQAARREAYEESAIYVDFNDTSPVGRTINGTDVFFDHHEYRGYFVGIPAGTFSADEARLCLQTYQNTRPYNEMVDVRRVYISDLEKSGVRTQQGDLRTVDAKGNPVIIKSRTKALIREALKRNIIDLVARNPRFVLKTLKIM